MKKVIVFASFLVSIVNTHGQLLLENKQGDPLYLPVISVDNTPTVDRSRLIKANTSDQSLGFNYFYSPSAIGTPNYKLWNFGISGKPTEGYTAVFKSGQFSPGVNISASFTRVKIFDPVPTMPNNNFIDWGSIYLQYGVSKYQFYNASNDFDKQLFTKNFESPQLGINYNALINSNVIISLKLGYARKNNFSKLKEVEVTDTKTSTNGNITRDVSTKKTAREGEYVEYESYPINLSFTKPPPFVAGSTGYQIGFNVYSSFLPANKILPSTDIGTFIFLTKTTNDIQTPVLALNFQFDDFFDVKRANNNLMQRLSFGITTNINITL